MNKIQFNSVVDLVFSAFLAGQRTERGANDPVVELTRLYGCVRDLENTIFSANSSGAGIRFDNTLSCGKIDFCKHMRSAYNMGLGESCEMFNTGSIPAKYATRELFDILNNNQKNPRWE